MKYFFIAFIYCFFAYSSGISASSLVADNVNYFDVSDRAIVYVKKDKQYGLYLNDTLIIESINPISYPSIDEYGSKVVFSSSSLFSEDRYCVSILDGSRTLCNDLYLYDIKSNTIKNITLKFNGGSYMSSISGDGRYVVFESSASNITGDYIHSCKSYKNGVDRNCINIYLYDLVEDKYILISKDKLSGRYDSMEPEISYDGNVVVFRSMESFFDDKKYCYNEFYDSYSYCSSIYMYKDKKLSLISDNKYDSYHGRVSMNGNVITFDSYSTMNLFDYHYQNSTFIYDIMMNKYKVINKSPNRIINNVMVSDDGKLNVSITSASNIVDSSSYKDNIVITNIVNGKSIGVDGEYNYDVKDVCLKDNIVYYLSHNKLFKKSLSSSGPIISSTRNLLVVKGKEYDLFKYVYVEDDMDENVKVYVVDYGGFSSYISGSYVLTLGAKDSDNNEYLYEYRVDVIDIDNVQPVFVGDNRYRVVLNDKSFRLSDYVSVYDNVDGELDYVVINGNIDISEVGKYKIKLKASDSSLNTTYYDVIIEVVDNKSVFNKYFGALCVVVCFVWYVIALKKK